MAVVLVADEGPADRALARTALVAARHSIVEAMSGSEALWALAREPVEVIVLDLSLPDMSGDLLIDRIREIAAHVLTPIIAMESAVVAPEPKARWWGFRKTEEETPRSPLADFAVERLAKPFAPHQLVEAVARALRARAELGAAAGDAQQRALGFDEWIRLQNEARDQT